MRNAFDHDVPEIRDIVQDEVLRDHLINVLRIQLTGLGSSDPSTDAAEIIRLGQTTDPQNYDEVVLAFTEDSFDSKRFQEQLKKRSAIMYGEIIGFIGKSPILDYGCGSGAIGRQLIEAGHDVDFADIYRHCEIPEGANFSSIHKNQKTYKPKTLLISYGERKCELQ